MYRVVIPREGIIASYKPLIHHEALLANDKYVLFIGSKDKVLRIAHDLGAEKIFIDGIMAPGFIDSHMHIDSLGLMLNILNLENISSHKELVEKIRSYQRDIHGWIIGRGYDHNLFRDKKEPPTRKQLDEVVKDKPVLLIHRSGHMAVTNTLALNILCDETDLCRDKRLVNPRKGWLFEDSVSQAYNYIVDKLSMSEYEELILKASNKLWGSGIVAVGVAGCNWKCLKALKSLDEKKLLRIRAYIYMLINNIDDLDLIAREAIITHKYYDKIRVNGVKIILDGALGTRTAYLTKPYNDEPGNQGKLLLSRGELLNIVRETSRRGLQLAIHCIGDACLDIVLDTYRTVGRDVSILRHRVEHASLVRDDQLGIIEEYKIVIVVQPRFILSDKWLIDRIGLERLRYAYRFKTLYGKTITCFSTDSPVEPYNPLETLYAALTRGIYEGLEHGKLTINECMNIADALDAYTAKAAWCLGDNGLGSLLPGKYYAGIVIDKNPLNIDNPRDILGLKIYPAP